VDWFPWGKEAFDRARKENKPVFLSVGYTTCHWCHVMEHESFENETTADLMNRLFVNIKVDREERPDLDRIYQLAHQFLTGRGGGWPLTVFLDPEELVPFFAGTYFPPERRYGMPGFREVLEALHQWFRDKPAEVRELGGKLRGALEAVNRAPAEAGPEADPATVERLLQSAADQLRNRHDPHNGGFGGPPCFPQAPLLETAALLGSRSGDIDRQLEFSLEQMALRGLRDHLDGGFFRYCVDGAWTIPHFEKMLYDNAMLLPLYAEGARRWDNALLRDAAEGIGAWAQAEMRQPSGGYAASIDADADGEEGGYHVWRAEEIEAELEEPARGLFRRAYGLDRAPNFEDRAWHLQRLLSTAELAKEAELDEVEVEAMLAAARRRLQQKRAQRVPPTLDPKRLTAWNALLAGGFARAARALGRDDWLVPATEIFEYIRRDLWVNGGLLAVYNDGQARFPAYLDDYAFLLQALLELLRARWDDGLLAFGVELADALLQRFEDPANGGFWFSDAAVEAPVTRNMIFQDDATPSGNAIAVMALNRMAHLLGEASYAAAADRCLHRALPRVLENPLAHASMLRALQEVVTPAPQLVLAGTDPQAQAELQRWAEGRYRVDCYAIGPASGERPGALGNYRTERPVTAWLCHGMQCLPPVHSREELQPMLD
jgi:uncharacterized protein YyaL (SSP411 family)